MVGRLGRSSTVVAHPHEAAAGPSSTSAQAPQHFAKSSLLSAGLSAASSHDGDGVAAAATVKTDGSRRQLSRDFHGNSVLSDADGAGTVTHQQTGGSVFGVDPPPNSAPNASYFAGFMLKGKRDELSRFFDLPPTETLREDFHCAMRKRVLLQGRMYIFDNYVCFYSAVFGFAKKRKFMIKDIVSLRKKKQLGFPNSIEIEIADGKKDFYTSFLSREDAFQLIQKLMVEAKRKHADGGDGAFGSAADSSHTAGDTSGRRAGRNGGGGADGPSPFARQTSDIAGVVRRSTSLHEDANGEDDEEEEDSGVWTVEPKTAPPVNTGSRALLHVVLPGTPKDFYDLVLADSSSFWEDFLESQGNRRINMSSWKRHEQLGHVRDLQFTSPIKGAFGNWGVSHTACYQSHRLCLYQGEHVVFESSQTMTDIPYGDCFTVDLRWDVRVDPHSEPDNPTIEFDIHMRVPFSRRCLFKAVIESGSYKQVGETYLAFVEDLRPSLEDAINSRKGITLRPGSRGHGGLAETASLITPRMTMARAGTMGRSLPSASSRVAGGGPLQRTGSMAAPTVGHVPSSHGGDPASQELGRGGGGGGVLGAILWAPRRAVGAVVSGFDSLLDVLMNVMQCPITPQMRYLVGLIAFMFLANCIIFVMMWSSSSPSPAVPSAGSLPGGLFTPGSSDGAALPPLAADGGSALGGVGAAGGGGGGGLAGAPGLGVDSAYWQARLGFLQQEIGLLQGRMEAVAKEVGMVVAQLASASAAATAAAAQAGAGPGGGGGAGEL